MSTSNYQDFFKGKNITKQGFGTLGRGFGVVKFLAECGAQVLVTDLKPRETFLTQIQELEKYPNIKYVLGEHREEHFLNCDFVISASGVPKDNFYLNQAKNHHIPVYQETSLFVQLLKDFFKDVKVIGITGTRGKTTTTFLVYELLRKKFGEERVHLGGNVQGTATLELLERVKDGDFVVLELDSWLLQGFADLQISPDISIFTTFMPDHMNYYKNNLKEYFDDKASIFKYQKPDNFFITTQTVENYIRDFYGQDYKNTLTLVGRQIVLEEDNIKHYNTRLLGAHNQLLLALTEQLSGVLGIEHSIFDQLVSDFSGVPGRLELLDTPNSFRIYNDTCATTPDALVVALNSVSSILPKDGKVFLICGGRDKDLSLDKLVDKLELLQSQDKLVLHFLSDQTTTGTQKLLEFLKFKNSPLVYREFKNLGDAVEQVKSQITTTDILLFSPGFTSFGMFENEYDRGDKFKQLFFN